MDLAIWGWDYSVDLGEHDISMDSAIIEIIYQI